MLDGLVAGDAAPEVATIPHRRALDPHAKPPESIRQIYKHYQRLDSETALKRTDLISYHPTDGHVKPVLGYSPNASLLESFKAFDSTTQSGISEPTSSQHERHNGPCEPYEIAALPGLIIYPTILTRPVQLALLAKLLHHDLAHPEHQTNVHRHYDVPYPSNSQSYFHPCASNLNFPPKDPSVHRPITAQQYLDKKLRWMTLGGQYDWTNKVYPSGPPRPFPADIKKLVEDIFPMEAEAAIVNLYSPGDTLSLHRDVSEECDRPLVSISLGCDGIFVVGLPAEGDGEETRVAVLRLRSGDAVLMSGECRYAWHGVPKVLEGTCPEWMQDWPFDAERGVPGAGDERFEHWKGWMKGKRVNLNVRQMFA